MQITLTVNGTKRTVEDGWAGESLLYVLRERWDLTGTKNACEQGECGSCTVRLDGVLVNSCLVLAAQADELDVETVEGLAATADGQPLHPVQRAFLQAGAVQCGFCTSGMVMAAEDLLRRISEPTEADVRREMAGNLCRCTGYRMIIEAVLLAAKYRHPAEEVGPR
jgi:aerobic carbon-monoxide dehydrogenase small subunit